MFGILNRWRQPAREAGEVNPVPNANVPIVHLMGPGRLRVDNERLAFDAGWDDHPPTRQVFIALDRLRHLCCYGRVQISVEALHSLLANNVNVALLSLNGRDFLGRIASEHGQKPLDRVIQSIVLARPEFRFGLARTLVGDKIGSQIGAARHFQRHGVGIASEPLDRLKALADQVKQSSSIESLRGIEGMAASVWFSLFARLIHKPFQFPKRIRRPPTDPVNALLSLGYTLLTARTAARLTALGYDVALGCLHEFRSGRPSLACDHVEPLRVVAVDRWVLRVLNERKLKPGDFEEPHPQRGVRLLKAALPRVVASWEIHWRESRVSDILDRQIVAFREKLREHRPRLPTLLAQLEFGDGWADS